MANIVQIQRMNKIVDLLRDKSHLSNKEAAKFLASVGEDVTVKYVQRLRNKKSNLLAAPESIRERINLDLSNGVKFRSATDIQIRYNVTRGYANVLMKMVSKGDYDRAIKRSVVELLPPVPVNTMAFYVQQLTANDSKYEVQANG